MPTEPTDSPRFTGFPVETFEFYQALAADNTRPWWQEHRAEYERAVRAPLVALLAELADEFGAGRLYRPYRDTRFSKDKSPLKDHQGAVVGLEDAVGYYVQVSASGLFVAGGWYAPAGRQLQRYREAVDSAAGATLQEAVSQLRRQRFEVAGNPVKTRPRGVAADHPRLDLMRNRSLTAARSYPVEAWLGTRRTVTVVRDDWRRLRPMLDWLADHVGPASDPADGVD